MQGTTPITIKKTSEQFEARMGIAIFGATNMNEDEFRAAQYNPFHDLFHDNFVKGIGATEEEAIANMKRDFNELYEGLWA